MTIDLELLVERPWFLPQVVRWCASQWPEYYEGGKFEKAYEYHLTTLQTERIPCGIVASESEGDKLIGTISLLEEDMDVRPQYRPWLGCLFVDPEWRGQGIARQLITFGEHKAAQLGCDQLFAWTHTLAGPLSALGWKEVERLPFLGREATIMRKSISI